MGIGSFFKKIISVPVRIVKAVVDPAFDLVTNTFKAIISPFTGAFDLPDVSVNFEAGTNEIKAATTVNFSAANRAIPVLYGHKVESATIPVFIGTWGDNSADTSRQYLYMAAIISQGFHGSSAESGVSAGMGSLLSRMTIGGKPVHLGGFTNTANPNYSQGYDGSTALNLQESDGGLFASGKGGVQPTQHSITKGTFANRLKIQYFDGSTDQPVSSLLDEHPEWSPTGQSKLSGMHYVALRFLLQAADVTVGAGDGGGTFGNPYNGLPAVVTTTSGRNTPNIMSGNSRDPGYGEKEQSSYAEKAISHAYLSHHKPLGVPASNGILSTIASVDSATVAIESDTVIQYERFRNHQPLKNSSGQIQPVNIHDLLFNLGWTYDFVFFVPGTYAASSEDRGQWLKHVGGSHYQFLNKSTVTLDNTIATSTLTFFAYNLPTVSGGTTLAGMTEAIINGVTPSEQAGDSTTAEYRWYGTTNETTHIESRFEAGEQIKLRIRDYDEGTTRSYNVTSIQSTGVSDSTAPFITLGLHEEDSTAVAANFYTTVPNNAEVTVEIYQGLANTDKIGAQWETAFADDVYLTDGLPYQAYTCDSNPVEMLLDYLLNPNYGVGLSVHDIDKKSFQLASIAGDTIPSYYDFDSTLFFMGGGSFFSNVSARNEYMYGEGATSGAGANGSKIQTMNNSYDRIFRIDTNKTHLANVNTILASIGATMPVIDGKFHLQLENAGIPEASEAIPPVTSLPITAVIDDDNVIGAITVATASVNDKFNQIKIDYTSIIDNSQPASVMSPDPVEDSTDIRVNYLAEDNNKKLEGNFSFPSIYDEGSAKKIATLLLKKSRGQPVLNLNASPIAMSCVPGDFVRINSEVLKINDVYRVTAATVNEDHTVGLSCIRHVPEFYDITDEGQIFEARRNIMDIK